MGDGFRLRPEGNEESKGKRRRQRGPKRRRGRRRNGVDDADDAFDSSDGDGEIHPSFFFDREDDEMWRDQYESDRLRRRHVRNQKGSTNQPLDSVRRWALEKTGVHIPRVNLHFDPVTVLKIRKSWHGIIPGAIIRAGADLETHRLGRGLWRLRGCVEDKVIGGRFTIREARHGNDGERAVLMQYSKSWLFAGAGE